MRLLPTKEFEYLWEELGGPPLTPEFQFHPTRKWRADYAHRPTNTLIEIEGGVWKRGRHTRPQGYTDDCIKYNAAAALGFVVFRFTPDMLTDEYLKPVIAWTQALAAA